jgi:hypothetical protein
MNAILRSDQIHRSVSLENKNRIPDKKWSFPVDFGDPVESPDDAKDDSSIFHSIFFLVILFNFSDKA